MHRATADRSTPVPHGQKAFAFGDYALFAPAGAVRMRAVLVEIAVLETSLS